MDKIWLIIQREYLTRVRKKELSDHFAAGSAATGRHVYHHRQINSSDGPDRIAVHDESGLNLAAQLVDTDELRFVPAAGSTLAEAQAAYQSAKPKQAALLYFPAGFALDSSRGPRLLAKGNVPLNRQSNIGKAVNKAIGELRMARSGLKQETIDNLQARVNLTAINLDEQGGQRNNAGATTGAAYLLSILVYMFIFIYGVQVMRGVSEEKSSRIMEVMISSVKPFQLMMGKILGIAGVVLTQFGLWLILSWGVTTMLVPLLTKDKAPTMAAAAPARAAVSGMAAAAEANSPQPASATASSADAAPAARKAAAPFSIMSAFEGLPLGSMIFGFLFFFLGGYLLYSALFAAIGSAWMTRPMRSNLCFRSRCRSF